MCSSWDAGAEPLQNICANVKSVVHLLCSISGSWVPEPICPMPKTSHLLVGRTFVQHPRLHACQWVEQRLFAGLSVTEDCLVAEDQSALSSQQETDEEDVLPRDKAEGSTRLCVFPPNIFRPSVLPNCRIHKACHGHSSLATVWALWRHQVPGGYLRIVLATLAAGCFPCLSSGCSLCLFFMSIPAKGLKNSLSMQLSLILHACDAGNNTTHLSRAMTGPNCGPGATSGLLVY